jgi:ribonucleoside-diphosphate reductase alpha chain
VVHVRHPGAVQRRHQARPADQSCYLNYVDDSRDGITKHYTETSWLASVGGGVGGYWGDIRSDGTARRRFEVQRHDPVHQGHDGLMAAFNQGTTRRGAYAAFQDISHPEIEEFIDLRDPNGDHARRCLGTGFHHGVCITDAFMMAVDNDGPWDLIDPKTKRVTADASRPRPVAAHHHQAPEDRRAVYRQHRHRQSLPAQPLKKRGLRIRASNLCTEIFLPTGWDDMGNMRTAVCCLSSVNLAKWDEWSPHAEQFIGDLIRMLDNVLQHFIDNAPPQLSWAVNSARMSRDLGLARWASTPTSAAHDPVRVRRSAVDQQQDVLDHQPLGSVNASRQLADERGEAPDMVGTGLHNAHLLAIAPNASTSIIAGVDPSIEPRRTNAFKQSTQAGMSAQQEPGA